MIGFAFVDVRPLILSFKESLLGWLKHYLSSREGCRTKNDYRKKGILVLSSLLEDLALVPFFSPRLVNLVMALRVLWAAETPIALHLYWQNFGYFCQS